MNTPKAKGTNAVEMLFGLYGDSPSRVAQVVGETKQCVSGWRKRGRIPVAQAQKIEAVTAGRVSQAQIVREHQMAALEARPSSKKSALAKR